MLAAYILSIVISSSSLTYPLTIMLEKGMAIHSSTIGWRIPQTEEPGGLQSMGSQRARHNGGLTLSLSGASLVVQW